MGLQFDMESLRKTKKMLVFCLYIGNKQILLQAKILFMKIYVNGSKFYVSLFNSNSYLFVKNPI